MRVVAVHLLQQVILNQLYISIDIMEKVGSQAMIYIYI